MMTKEITITASAKVNLFLHVTGKRADGYHLLDSLVAFADYGDLIKTEESDKISLDIIGEHAASLSGFPIEENLVWKAAIALQNYAAKPLGAKITLEKRLPVASGIGGGSADAAAVILALVKLWKLDISEHKLSVIALSLGSDVPVCLYGKPALMRGIGEEIIPISLDKPYIVIVNPNIPLATADIFRESDFKPLLRSDDNKEIRQFSSKNLTIENGYRNDLENTAIKQLPVIANIIASIKETKGCFLARMSGSGATCFGLYDDKVMAQKAAEELKNQYPQAWCINSVI